MSNVTQIRKLFGIKGYSKYLGRGLYSIQFDANPEMIENRVQELVNTGLVKIISREESVGGEDRVLGLDQGTIRIRIRDIDDEFTIVMYKEKATIIAGSR